MKYIIYSMVRAYASNHHFFELRLMSRIKKQRERNVHTHRTWMQWLTDNISDMYNDHNPIITKSI